MKYSVPLVHVATHIDALMARDAAERLKQLVPGELLGGHHVSVAFEPSIKSASGREEGPLVGCDGADQSRAIGLPAIGFPKLTGDIRVGLQLVYRLLHTRPHDLGFAQALLDLVFKRAKIAFPIQTEAQRSVEHCRDVQLDGASSRVGRADARAVRRSVMTRIAATSVVMRKTRVVEQAIAERYLPLILDRRGWDRRDRLLVSARLRRRPLCDRPPCGAKGQNDQDQTRYSAAGSGDDRCQSQAAARGRHGQFTPSSSPQQNNADRQATVLAADDPQPQIMILDHFVDNNIQALLASGRKKLPRQLVRSEH